MPGGPTQEQLPFMSFDELGLAAELLRAVVEKGYSEPTPIQRQAIPSILAGRDVLAGCALGVAHACLGRFMSVAPAWFGYPEGPLLETDVSYLFATGVSAGRLFDGMMFGVSTALISVLLYIFS